MGNSARIRISAVAAAATLFATAALAADESTASLPPPEVSVNALPQPLSAEDATRYRTIFALQEKGKWRHADREIKELENRLLMGHVLAQRYMHPTHYRSRYGELAQWMKAYADHPDASRIYKLAMQRKSKQARAPRRPRLPEPVYYGESGDGGIERIQWQGVRTTRHARRLHARIRGLVRRQRLTAAEDVLNSRQMKRLGEIHIGIAEARIAAGWFYFGNDEKAFSMGDRAARRAGEHAPFGHWYAGLAAFRLGRYTEAADQFQALAATGGQSRSQRAAAAFWAARANMSAQRPDRVSRWLRLAASFPRTFYGVLGRRMLGADSPFDWDEPPLNGETIAAALNAPRAQRALALLQIGNRSRAARELRYLAAASTLEERIVLLVIADRNNLPSVALRTAASLSSQNSHPIERGLYPVPGWTPHGGFSVDRALIFAVMRQESAFNPRAKSRAGARGLMQLMPGTAGYMARKRFRGQRRNQLFDPALNMSLGQKYLRYLLQHDLVEGDLFMMAAAYNGGPGNLSKWTRRVLRRTSDPLLVIESLPSRETRDFIERVMANLWIYRERFGQLAPSLEAIAEGKRPIYRSLDPAIIATTDNGRN